VGRVALLGFVLLALLAAGCGGKSVYSVEKTRTCLEARGAKVGGKLDFVASTATGGAFAAALGTNSVKLVFGQTQSDAEQIVAAYQRFAFRNVRNGLPDVLRRYNNVVTLWHEHPQDADLSLVVGCLR
jgi:hypothetical protein